LDKRIYEVVYIVQPTMAEDDLNQLSTSLQQILTSQGAEIVKAEAMGRRQLAYPIGRVKEGQ
jgi:small subunit ribosomal protein S6